jgi:hypothetical protein
MAGDSELQRKLDFEAQTESLKREAERALDIAEDLARSNDGSADTAYERAERLAIRAADPELLLRMHDGFGRFLGRQRAFARARRQFRKAEQTAQTLGREEDVARLEIRIVEMGIELAGDKKKGFFFKNFKKAVQDSDSHQNRLDVWCAFIDDFNKSGGRLAARNFGSTGDFRSRLDYMKRGRGEGNS